MSHFAANKVSSSSDQMNSSKAITELHVEGMQGGHKRKRTWFTNGNTTALEWHE